MLAKSPGWIRSHAERLKQTDLKGAWYWLFAALVCGEVWLLSSVGIAASDFLCRLHVDHGESSAVISVGIHVLLLLFLLLLIAIGFLLMTAAALLIARLRDWADTHLFAVSETASGQAVMPNFAVVGKTADRVTMLWHSNHAQNVFPKQIAVDVNDRGIIYGVVCEYWWNEAIFAETRATLEKEIGAMLKSGNGDYCVWRDDKRKLAISLFHDLESNTIKLIAVSIDERITGKTGKGDGKSE